MAARFEGVKPSVQPEYPAQFEAHLWGLVQMCIILGGQRGGRTLLPSNFQPLPRNFMTSLVGGLPGGIWWGPQPFTVSAQEGALAAGIPKPVPKIPQLGFPSISANSSN